MPCASLLLLGGLALAGSWSTVSTTAMATPMALTLPAEQADKAELAWAALREVEELANEWRPGTPIARVNAQAGGAPVPVPDEVFALVQRSLELGTLTGGAFDLTWAALWGTWDFRTPGPVPDPALLAARAALVDHRKVELDPAAHTVRLPEAGMKLGLGGIAKGWGLDRAARALRAAGVTDFSLSAGGQVYAAGSRDGRPWRVGIRDPRGALDDAFALVEIRDASVSTSGDYERFFVADGQRWHHVLDPHTGWPARGLRSATIVCPDATLADALSTAVMVLGRDAGLALVARLDGVEAVVVDEAGQVFTSRGLALHVLHAPRP